MNITTETFVELTWREVLQVMTRAQMLDTIAARMPASKYAEFLSTADDAPVIELTIKPCGAFMRELINATETHGYGHGV